MSSVPLASSLTGEVLDTVTQEYQNSSITPYEPDWQTLNVSSSSFSKTTGKTTATSASYSTGTITQCTNVTASCTPYKKIDNSMCALVAVSFTPGTGFNYCQIWAKNYHGSSNWAGVGQGSTSPVSFEMDLTGETVTLQITSVSADGKLADGTPPTCTVALNGVTTAPPAVSNASVSTTPVGSVVTWSYISGLESNVIDGYWVWHSTTNDYSTATRYQHFAHSTVNAGSCQCTETLASGAVRYYWITTVDIFGNENTASAAYAGTTTSISPITSAGTVVSNQTQSTSTDSSSTAYPSSSGYMNLISATLTVKTNSTAAVLVLGYVTCYLTIGSAGGDAQGQFALALNHSSGYGLSSSWPVLQAPEQNGTGTTITTTVPLMYIFSGIGPGTYTFSIAWAVNQMSGTGTLHALSRSIQAVQIG